MPEILRRLLAMADEIGRLPERTAEALHDLQTRLVLNDVTRLLPAHAKPGAKYLRAEYAIVPFHPARRADLEQLLAWCEEDSPKAVRLLHGPGGYGKSRLAIELARELRRRGWHTGFLDRETDEAPPETFRRLFNGQQNICVIVDYAETRREPLVRVLKEAWRGGAPRICILLIARAEAEWWEELQGSDQDIEDLFEDQQIQAQGSEKEKASQPAINIDFSDHEYGRVLLIHIAALLHVQGETPGAADQLLARMLRRERREWEAGMRELGSDKLPILEETIALATLRGGCDDEFDLQKLMAMVRVAAGQHPTTIERLRKLIERLYPERSGVGALRPDLIGEQLIEELLKDAARGELWPLAFGGEASPDDRMSALTIVGRLVMRKPECALLLDRLYEEFTEPLAMPAIGVGTALSGSLVDRYAQKLLSKPLSLRVPVAQALQGYMDHRRVPLLEIGAAVEQTFAEAERIRVAASEEGAPEALAFRLNRWSVYLSNLGRREAALAATEEAVASYRELAAARPDAFLPDLSVSLSVRADCLDAMDRSQEALVSNHEAVAALAPAFFRHPEAEAARMAQWCQEYLQRCEKLKVEPDKELLAPIIEAFGSLKQDTT